jgi:multidrug resistance efflux pump
MSQFISILEASSYFVATQYNLTALATVATAKLKPRRGEAAAERAKLNLVFTRLTSPIDGIAGQAQLHVGDLVNASSAPVTV